MENTMTPGEALKTFEQLILSVMTGGGFKDFATLDKCRNAHRVLHESITSEQAQTMLIKEQEYKEQPNQSQ